MKIEKSSSAKISALKKILIFSPHPDDDIIGCGGSIAKHKKNGHDASIVYMTSGDAGSLQYSKKELIDLREKEATKAAETLGVTKLHFLRNADGYLTHDEKNLIQLISLIRKEQPNIVYIPHHSDAHADHIITHKLVVEAVKRADWPCFQECPGNPWSVGTILCYEVWTPLQEVSYCEDISEFMELKLQALRQHTSQLSRIKFDDAIKGLNRYRSVINSNSAKQAGMYSEAFQVIKLNNDDLSTLIQG